MKNILLLSLLFIASLINAQCDSRETMDKCYQLQNESLNSYCVSGTLENQNCLCERLPALIGCLDNCPQDVMSLSRKGQLEQRRMEACNNARNISPNGLNLFQVSKSASNVIIQAGATQISVPTNGLSIDNNRPVIGSLYNSYSVGSLTVGYKTASNNQFMSGIRPASNGFKLSIQSSTLLLTLYCLF